MPLHLRVHFDANRLRSASDAWVGFGLFLVPLGFFIGWLATDAAGGGYGAAGVFALVTLMSWRARRRARRVLSREEKRRDALTCEQLNDESEEIVLWREAYQQHTQDVNADHALDRALAETREREEAIRREADAYVIRDQSLRSTGDDLVAAFAKLPLSSTGHQHWLRLNANQIERAGRELFVDEQLLYVAVAQGAWMKFCGIVLTSQRIGAIYAGSTEWMLRRDVTSASSIPSVRGRSLDVRGRTASFQWWEVEPKEAGKTFAGILKGRATPQLQQPASDGLRYGAIVVESKAEFVGGIFAGNQARSRSALPVKLADRSSVILLLNDKDEIVVTRKSLVSEGPFAIYPVDHPAIDIDTATAVTRRLKTGRLVGTAAATLAIGPLGLAGLVGSVSQRTKASYVLTISDGEDYGIFAIFNSELGAQLAARRRDVVNAPTAEGHVVAPRTRTVHAPRVTADPEKTPTVADELERLVALRDTGAISTAEYEQLKAQTIGRTTAEPR